jgi:hypothetical protein
MQSETPNTSVAAIAPMRATPAPTPECTCDFAMMLPTFPWKAVPDSRAGPVTA